MKLEDFCAASDGRVLALASPVVSTTGARSPAREQDKVKSEVRIFDIDGKLAAKWKLDFHGQAINVGPDGSIYIGGAGRVAQYDLKGERLAQGDAPQAGILKDREKLRAAAAGQLKQEKEAYGRALKSMEQSVKALEEQVARLKRQTAKGTGRKGKDEDEKDKPAGDDAEEEIVLGLPATPGAYLKLYRKQAESYKTHLDELEKKTLEEAMQEVIASRLAINAVAVGDQDVYVACRAETGYGYAIWRTDLKFGNPRQIVARLVGCCGQMDIQAAGDEVWVAENARHRVVKYDREGKQLLAFGKRDREGAGECFSGCCNPMNLCFDKSGELLVSESNGVVKHFGKDGKFVGIVGVADVRPGCKNSAIGVTPDGRRVFYIDINKSKVIVLSRVTDEQAATR